MISADKILYEYEFWDKARKMISDLQLQDCGVMDEVISVFCKVYHNALYGNEGKMFTEEKWNDYLNIAKSLYNSFKDIEFEDIDATMFYKARCMLWATAVVAGLDPHEVVDFKEDPQDEVPVDNITDITTEIV